MEAVSYIAAYRQTPVLLQKEIPCYRLESGRLDTQVALLEAPPNLSKGVLDAVDLDDAAESTTVARQTSQDRFGIKVWCSASRAIS